MYENGKKHPINIELPSFKFIKFNKNGDKRPIFDIIKKILVVALFFFMFVFCISKYGQIIEAKEIDEDQFNGALTYIKGEVLDFYDSKNSPKNAGDSKSLTFDELINLKVIDKNKIKDLGNCDKTKSTVVVTKEKDNKYYITIHVECDGIIQEKEDIVEKL